MKVLLINKFFYPKGGAEVSFLKTADLLEQRGHRVSFFAMDHPLNPPSPFAEYFVSHVEFDEHLGGFRQVTAAARLLYSLEARRNLRRLLERERPDMAHLHNIYHQISPSIIDVLWKRKIPTVMTLRDYKLTCPVYTHLSNGKVCEKCVGGRYYHVVSNRCTKGSLLKSSLNMLEMYLHHKVLRIYEKVDMFISPSRFLLEKTKEMGFAGELIYLPNFVNCKEYDPLPDWKEKHIVYFGRLSKEKGLLTLLEAIKGLDVQLKIIGEGPERETLKNKAKTERIKNVLFLGYRKDRELTEEIRNSMFAVLPSEWYENNPRSIIEAFALGKPVVASRIGGIPELVKDKETGLLFTPGDPRDLREKIQWFLRCTDAIVVMGKNARQFVERELNPESHYTGLMQIYNRAIEKKKK